MKRSDPVATFAALVGGFLILGAMASCERRDVPMAPDDKSATPIKDPILSLDTQGITVRTDPITGCQYLAYYSHGITPRLNAFGHPICTGPVK